ncbi:MAG: uroporphyrinogen decarboxylase family protein [Treponema sp.]|nr:uroporphyrinogen decarboxylase family protein [Treponema sp.]
MNSRERVVAVINHKIPDKVPVDLGGTCVSSISATAYYRLREALGLEKKPVEIFEMLQFVAKVDDDVRQGLGVDTIPLPYPVDTLGNSLKERKEFITPIGIPALVSKNSEWDVLSDGSVVMYPCGDRSVPPSLHMLNDGMYFDNITDRIPEIDEDNLRPLEDFKDDFSFISDDIAEHLLKESKRLFTETDYAVVGQFPGAMFGDSGLNPGPGIKRPRGIRKMDDWLMAHLLHPEYLEAVYDMQMEFVMRNLEIYRQAVGGNIQVILVNSADFGTQNAEMIAPEIYRKIYKPRCKRINDWIHENTNWKIMYHSCGSIVNLLDDFVEMGVDIINPVQLSAKGMDAKMLKEKYKGRLVFWGGGIDTQKTLPFGTPEEVRREALERLELLSKGSGYIFNPVHNIVGKTSVKNILAFFNAAKEFNGDSLIAY